MTFRLAVLPLLALCLGAARPADRLISLNVRDADVLDVIRLLAVESGINIITDGPIKSERITMYLRSVPFDRVLNAVLRTQHLEARADGSILVIRTRVAMTKTDRPRPRAHPVFHAPAVRRLEGGGISTRVMSLHFLKPSDALERLQGIVPDPSYVADDEANTLIVTGNEQAQDKVKALLAAVDVGNRQVTFDVQILDIVPEANDRNAAAQSPSMYVVVRDSSDVQAWLKALMQRGLAQLLARPQLLTLDGRQAELVARQTYPEVFYDSKVGEQIEFVQLGVTLQTTPTIESDASVKTRLHARYSTVTRSSGGYPIFGNRSIGATLRVGVRQTIVFAGAMSDIDSGILEKVPALLDDPVFGKVFRQRSRTHGKDAIVFLITPHNTGSRPHPGKLQARVPVSHRW